jgi:hypothetical protein
MPAREFHSWSTAAGCAEVPSTVLGLKININSVVGSIGSLTLM